MKLTIPNSGNWLAAAANWRREGRDRLEPWLPRDWPREDAELRRRRVASTGAVRQGGQRGLEGLAPAEEIIVWTPAAETVLLSASLPTRSAAKIVHPKRCREKRLYCRGLAQLLTWRRFQREASDRITMNQEVAIQKFAISTLTGHY